eukprot:1884053-Rhodomonas_salina.1
MIASEVLFKVHSGSATASGMTLVQEFVFANAPNRQCGLLLFHWHAAAAADFKPEPRRTRALLNS